MSSRTATFPIFGRLRPTLFAVSLAFASAIAACSDSSPTNVDSDSLTGSRPMRTANNNSVPTTFTDGSGKKLTITSGSLTITAAGKYALAYVGHLGTLEFDLEDVGVVTTDGNKLTFSPADGEEPFNGVLTGDNTITAGFKIAGVKFDLGFRQ